MVYTNKHNRVIILEIFLISSITLAMLRPLLDKSIKVYKVNKHNKNIFNMFKMSINNLKICYLMNQVKKSWILWKKKRFYLIISYYIIRSFQDLQWRYRNLWSNMKLLSKFLNFYKPHFNKILAKWHN